MSNRHSVLVLVRIHHLGARSRSVFNVKSRSHYARQRYPFPNVQEVDCASGSFWIGKQQKLQVSLRVCGNIRSPANYFWTCMMQIRVAVQSTPYFHASRFLGLLVWIPPGTRISGCCVLSCRSLYFGFVTRPEEPYRVWGAWVWLWNLKREEALAHKVAVEGKITYKYCILTVSKGRTFDCYRGVLPHVALNGIRCNRDPLHLQSVVWRGPTTTLYCSDCEKIDLTATPNPMLIKFIILY